MFLNNSLFFYRFSVSTQISQKVEYSVSGNYMFELLCCNKISVGAIHLGKPRTALYTTRIIRRNTISRNFENYNYKICKYQYIIWECLRWVMASYHVNFMPFYTNKFRLKFSLYVLQIYCVIKKKYKNECPKDLYTHTHRI